MRTQTQNRKDIRGKYDERVQSDCEYGRDGVHSKEQIAGLDHKQHDQKRRSGQRCGRRIANQELSPAIILR